MTTTTIKLDTDTGLPVLPEDLFWRIKEEKLVVGDDYVIPEGKTYGTWVARNESTGTVRIELVKLISTEIPAKPEVTEVITKRWLGIFPYEETITTQEAEPAKPEQIEVVAHGSLLDVRSKPVDPEDYDDRDWVEDSWNGGAWKATPPSKENIRDLSSKVWASYLTDQHTLALTEDGERELAKFLGDYPPKNLNTVGV